MLSRRLWAVSYTHLEYIGDVMNVVFANGWIADEDGKVFIYYASSETRMHVATSTIDRLVDYCMNTPKDDYRTQFSVEKIKACLLYTSQTAKITEHGNHAWSSG